MRCPAAGAAEPAGQRAQVHRARPYSCCIDYHDGTLVIEVEDTGIGIAAQHLDRISTPLRRPMRPPRGSLVAQAGTTIRGSWSS